MIRAAGAALLCAVLALAGAIGSAGRAEAEDAGWATYRDRFVTGDGRVLDSGNQKVSHTEGQGWAMLLAEAFGDRACFDKVWSWTRDTLQRRDNALFAWKWDPDRDKDRVVDPNDASDGDILIAWALSRGARRWNEPTYAQAARRIVADIRIRLLSPASGRLLLLPGSAGFKSADGTILNPSYYIFPAFNEFARLLPSPDWARLRRDGLALLADARFGRWGLTPDWIDLKGGGTLGPASNYPWRFGFDAIRVPLYLVWAGDATTERLASYLDFWNGFGDKPVPAWVDLTDNSVAPYAGSTGFQAIIRLARTYREPDARPAPAIGDKDDYYSASLTLLAGIASREIPR